MQKTIVSCSPGHDKVKILLQIINMEIYFGLIFIDMLKFLERNLYLNYF